MAKSPSTVLCTYRVKADCEQEFLALQREHWPTLRRLGLATDDEPLVYRGEDELTRSAKGTGIGLALVRELALAMNGRVECANAEGGGLRVSVRLLA